MMKNKKLRPNLLSDNNIHEKIVVSGFSYRTLHDFFHSALTISWRKFIFFYIIIFIFINLIFACLYSILPNEVANSRSRFIDAFFLSIQTMSTVGYGSIAPSGDFANIISSIEITFGIIVVALSTGIIFARFSKPLAKIIFANRAVISLKSNAHSLDIRMANGRKTLLLDVTIQVFLCTLNHDAQNRAYRKVEILPLIQSHVPIFRVIFEANHIINELSPLHGYDMSELRREHSEIAIKITGLDEGTGQIVYSYHTYNFRKISENYQFQDILYQQRVSELFIDMKNFNKIEPILKTSDHIS